MKYNVAEGLLNDALQRFVNYTGHSFDGEIYLLSRSDIKGMRAEIIKEIGAEFEEFAQSTLGETIYGTEGIVIFIYPFNINNESEFYHTVFHECAHKYFKEMNPEITQKQFSRAYGRRKLYGYTLFDEFIADAIANGVANEKPLANKALKQKELVQRLYQSLPGINPDRTVDALNEQLLYRNGIRIIPTGLGIYSAMLLTDPTITDLMQNDPNFERGFSVCNNSVIMAVEDIVVWLAEYLSSHGDYIITEEQLDELGKLVLRLENLR